MRKHVIIALGVAVAITAAPVMTTPVMAQSTNTATVQTVGPVTIPITYGKGAVGSEKVLATKTVPNAEYKVKVESHNQESIHPNTDMIVRSNGDQVEVKDIESAAFKTGTAEGTLKVTDGKVTVSVKFGKDGVFSGGVTVTLTPVEAPKPPEEPKPPVTPPTTPEEPKTPETPATPETPKTPEAPAPEVPAELPATGSAAVIGAATGLGLTGYATHLYVASKRRLGKINR